MRKFITVAMLLLLAGVPAAFADTDVAKLEGRARDALAQLKSTEPSTADSLDRAAGVLVFPRLLKAGAGIGAEYGKGVLLERGVVTGVYNQVAGSVGLQLGVQRRAQVIAFMDADALAKFKASKGWEAGVDGSIVIAKAGVGGQADTKTINAPIIGYVLDEKGLMYNATLEGAKITQLDDLD